MTTTPIPPGVTTVTDRGETPWDLGPDGLWHMRYAIEDVPQTGDQLAEALGPLDWNVADETPAGYQHAADTPEGAAERVAAAGIREGVLNIVAGDVAWLLQVNGCAEQVTYDSIRQALPRLLIDAGLPVPAVKP